MKPEILNMKFEIGGQLFDHNNGLSHQKNAPRGISPNIPSPLEIHLGIIFRVFVDLWGSVLKHFFAEFWDRFFMDFGFISTQTLRNIEKD